MTTISTPAGGPPVMRLKTDPHHARTSQVSTWTIARRLPAALRSAARLGWAADRRAMCLMLTAQIAMAVLAAVALAETTSVMRQGLDVLTAYTGHHPTGPLLADMTWPVAIVLTALIGRSLTDAAAQAAAARLGPKAARQADLQVLHAAAGVELAAYEHPGFEDSLEAAGRGADSARELLADTQAMISALAQLAAAATVLLALHPALLGCLVLAALPRGLAAVKAARIEHAAAHDTLADTRLRSVLRNYATDRNTATELRACNMGAFLTGRYQQVSDRLEHEALTAALRGLRTRLTGDAVSGLAMLAAWAVLALLVTNARIDAAAAGTAVIAMRTAAGMLTGMMRAGARLFRTSLFLDDWTAFLHTAHDLRTHRGTTQAPADGPTVISARDVTFTYPGTEQPALRGVDLDLKKGEVVALVGENGSGKTTLAHLLTGLYLPDTGTVAWDQTDLATADPHTVWQSLALVPQDYTRWPLTCRENITLGTSAPDGDTAVHRAAREAGAAAVVEKLPQGLDTSLARSWWGGHDLSGGQWQRIAIARAFHRNAPVLILDEPTAALDARAEHQVFSRLRQLSAGRTALFITHRLANARVADCVIVLDQGQVVGNGTYDELLRDGGLFAELHAMQDGTGEPVTVPSTR
ncbi:ABC transporter ATP-binding protein [Streptomyces sp. NPDC050145]|uniref:ABC transporter ATP-binding protein n=1 Tax=Streptomyces sp. NPDC050145 TaxID=3365602 RepID=UPI0037B7C3D6